MEREQVIFTIILHAGNARSYCFEALAAARSGKHKDAAERLDEATKELQKAHAMQTNLLQLEAQGEKQEVSLLLVHAQDHLMNALLAKDLIKEMIGMLQDK
ncbi:PTS lactose/cellobiose transporter subunit IIA [Pelosinus sp. UFO1]|uniref:PTS lactose/cellobiose transporter subunit IIA n=1 Tax=Pelosinus sp. UFO1 TaxID=484770 RepID=UPI0004D1D25E|nr:PTS lactose/cellobiose transporter subunit IIA [Pelosinus sp. UFO1]AIF54306.1 phosphotransferase system PTS lactose/cellobiose-specific IIA subunit [Pelosinus sp. UFO1]